MTGSSSVLDNDVTLIASSLPPYTLGVFLTSPNRGAIANPRGSQGMLCLDNPVGRYLAPGQIQLSDNVGSIWLTLDLALTPTPTGFVAVQTGETHHFQLWHRDLAGGSATSNFTNGLSIHFN